MYQPQHTITPQQIHNQAATLSQKHLQLQDHGPLCTARNVLTTLFYAAARVISLAAACGSLREAPSDCALRQALLATLPNYHELQRRLNRALQGNLPKALRRKPQPLAIDLTLIPYHGLPLHHRREIYRNKAKSGTTHFHAYATAYVLRKGQRFTVALTYVHQEDNLADIVKDLLRQAAKGGIRPRYVLFDRGFYTVRVIRYLQAARYPFVMPVPCRGRQADHPQGPSSTRVFHLYKRSGFSRHTLKNDQGQKATISIGVRCRNQRGQRGKHGRVALVYGYWGLSPSSWVWLGETYRSRFGIETTYRQMNQSRIRTCTRDPLLRLLYVGLALLLRNVWVWLHWEVLSIPRRGGRVLDLNQLVFREMLYWLQQVAEEQFGVRSEISSQHALPL